MTTAAHAAPRARWSGARYWPDPTRGFHPYLPERLGLRILLRLVNPELARLLQVTDAYTLVSARNRLTLHREAVGILHRGVAGDFVEIGVHRGGTAAVLAAVLQALSADRTLHLFDRWGDLPDPTPEDGTRAEEYRRDRIEAKLRHIREHPPLADAQHVLHDVVGFPAARTRYHPGWYAETLALTRGVYTGGAIAFASIDCDYYQSTVLALSFFLRHASPGAVAVIDDYGSWPGSKRAVQETLAGNASLTLRTLATGPAVLRVPQRRA